MFTVKVIAYSATILAAMLFAVLENREKRRLTDIALQPSKMVSDLGAINLSEQIRREQTLESLPKQAKSKYRLFVVLKLLFVSLLIAEVLIFQR